MVVVMVMMKLMVMMVMVRWMVMVKVMGSVEVGGDECIIRAPVRPGPVLDSNEYSWNKNPRILSHLCQHNTLHCPLSSLSDRDDLLVQDREGLAGVRV